MLHKITSTMLFLFALAGVNASAQINLTDYSHLVSNGDWSLALRQALVEALDGGDRVHIPAGTYVMEDFQPIRDGFNFSVVDIQGAGRNVTTIRTNRFWIDAISILKVKGLAFQGMNASGSGPQDTSLLLLKGASTVEFRDNSVNNGAEGLVTVYDAGSYDVSNNLFSNSGVGNRTPGGKQSGTALGINEATSGVVAYNTFTGVKGIGIFVGNAYTQSLTINGNDVTNSGYGTGVYVAGDDGSVLSNTQNVSIQNCTFHGFTVNGIRINGTNQTVSNNHFYSGGTSAIKAHFLRNSTISGNYINKYGSGTGIELVALNEALAVRDVDVTHNTVLNAGTGIAVTYSGNATYSDVALEYNTINESSYWGIAMWHRIGGFGTRIVGNTLTNSGSPFAYSAMNLNTQNSPFVASNTVNGQAGSANYGHIYLNNVHDATFSDNVITSPNCVDRSYGGFMLNHCEDITVTNTRFTNIDDPGYRLNPGVLNIFFSGSTFQFTCN